MGKNHEISDGFQHKFRKTLGDRSAHLLASRWIAGSRAERSFSRLGAWPLGVAVPKPIGTTMQPRTKRTAMLKQVLG